MAWSGCRARGPGNRFLTGLAIACVLVLDSRASEADRTPPSDYALRHWGTDDGLPSHTITDIKQALDGYLWMASTAGLIRFDGHRFTVFDQRNAGLTNPRIAAVSFLDGGGIRVIGEDFAILETPSMAPPRFTARGRLPKGSEAASPRDASTLVDRSGNVWLQAADGIEVRERVASLLKRQVEE